MSEFIMEAVVAGLQALHILQSGKLRAIKIWSWHSIKTQIGFDVISKVGDPIPFRASSLPPAGAGDGGFGWSPKSVEDPSQSNRICSGSFQGYDGTLSTRRPTEWQTSQNLSAYTST